MPSREDARRIACDFAGEDVVELDRYPTGLCHWVYRCETASGRVFVLRVARPENRDYIAGGIANSRLLAERGAPVARVLGGDVTGEATGFPWMAVERSGNVVPVFLPVFAPVFSDASKLAPKFIQGGSKHQVY